MALFDSLRAACSSSGDREAWEDEVKVKDKAKVKAKIKAKEKKNLREYILSPNGNIYDNS
ncbi:MAG: hypothetical protein A3A85_02390 [Deltaproteobacteria bacterium RIFCSPLOWO2_01_FULL_42_9]|nr:MAG: hypothetical protein A3A85_02390 [Deltaproteobacteria bacterium RIFCSPLOWO2_01_FULL_42_9]